MKKFENFIQKATPKDQIPQVHLFKVRFYELESQLNELYKVRKIVFYINIVKKVQCYSKNNMENLSKNFFIMFTAKFVVL